MFETLFSVHYLKSNCKLCNLTIIGIKCDNFKIANKISENFCFFNKQLNFLKEKEKKEKFHLSFCVVDRMTALEKGSSGRLR